jgi:hypothetical protein
MALPANVVRFEIRGTGPGSEIWVTSFWSGVGNTIADVGDLQTAVDAIQGRVATMWNAIKANVFNTVNLTELRGYYYSAGGPDADFAASHIYTPVPGTLASGSPLETCLVVSLRTGRVGQSFRGRMYLPYQNNVISNGFVAGIQATYASAVAAMLSGVNTDLGANTVVVVVSRMLALDTIVTAVTCDSKPDVQRRRQNRLGGGVLSTSTVTHP